MENKEPSAHSGMLDEEKSSKDDFDDSTLDSSGNDFIPSSDDEEGAFYDSDLEEELEERAQALTESELQAFREVLGVEVPEDELRNEWKKYQIPKYGRRAKKAQPILVRDGDVKFECICDIDRNFSRHYVPHFGGGVAKEGEELRTPHFRGFWEEYRDQVTTEDITQWNKILEKKETSEKETKEKGYILRPMPKFQGSTTQDIKNFRQRVLSTFRPLESREIRRFRMPYAEALYLELQEDRYIESAQFFKHLILRDYYVHSRAEQGSPLRKNKSRLNKVVAFLKLAEKLGRRKEYHKEANILLRSGKYFQEHDETWWWLAKEFYMRAVKVSQKSVIDGGKSEAIARYILGTFLLDHISDVQSAQEHLSKARELSLGKKWTAERILNKRQEPVYKECTNHLCRALIAASTELRKNGKPEEALPLIHNSYKLCREPCFMRRDIEMQTYFELGMTYVSLGMLNWAKIAFKKFIEIAKIEKHRKNVCDGYLELAICFRRQGRNFFLLTVLDMGGITAGHLVMPHKSEGDLVRCHQYLTNYLEMAEESQNENLIAFGNRYLGEYYLHNGNARKAAQYFQKAFNSFLKQWEESKNIPFNELKPEHFTLSQEVELTRALFGISQGEVYTKRVCHLILQVNGTKSKEEIARLILWKNKKIDLEEEVEIFDEKQEEFDSTFFPATQFFFQDIGTCELCGQQIGGTHECDNEVEDDKKTVRFDLKKSHAH